MLEDIKQKVDVSLDCFLRKIQKEYKLHLVHPILFNSIKEFILRDAKRIRPILLILSYKGYSTKNIRLSTSFYNASTCIELLHDFMLIHDDIIDRSDLRRGKPTLHRLLARVVKPSSERLGYDLGIIAGDIVYALAIDAFLSIQEDLVRKEKALKYFVKTAAFTAMGEFIDTLHSVQKINQIKEKDVFLNYTLKTARYTFDCPLVIGALLAGARDRDISNLSKLGLMIGQAFQIQDDIIGIFDTQKNIGKSILCDLTESKKTLLVCHAFQKLSGKDRANFLKYFSKPKKTYQDLIAVRKIFVNAGSLDYSLKQISLRIKTSRKILKKLQIKPAYRDLIEGAILSPFKPSRVIAKLHSIPFED